MEEKLIEFETAILAKEKGFDEPCLNMFTPKGEPDQCKLEDVWGHYNSNLHTNISAPTQALLQKWLREEHGIHIQPQKTFHNKTYKIGQIPVEFRIWGKENDSYGKPNSYLTPNLIKYKTYEDTLEAGLLIALNSIKNIKNE